MRARHRRPLPVIFALVLVLLALLADIQVAAAAFTATGYTTKTKDFVLVAGQVGGGTRKCPAGQRVIAGGAYWYDPGQPIDPALAAGAWLAASLPTKSGTAWFASGYTQTAALTLRITVHCVVASRIGPYTINQTTFTRNSTAGAGGYAACPIGQGVVTGGTAFVVPGMPIGVVPSGHRITGSSPTLQTDGWYGAGYGVPDSFAVRVVALCRPKAAVGKYSVETLTANVAYGHTAGTYVSCPVQQRIVASGLYWHTPGQGPNPLDGGYRLGSLAPTLDKRGMYGAALNLNGDSEITLVALCRPT